MNTALAIKVSSEGSAVGSDFQLSGLDIAMELNRIPWARLSYLDGDPAKPEFKVANSGKFKPGKSIEIELSYLGPDAPSGKKFKFKGIVTGHSLEVDDQHALSVIEIKDKAYALTRGRHSRFFEDMADSDILGKILQEYSGVSKGDWAKTSVKHEKMLQYDATDWDFLLMRAEANGLLVAVENDKINLLKASSSPGSSHTLDYGNGEIYNLEIEADGSYQVGKQTATAWDYKEQKPVESKPPAAFRLKVGDLDGKAIASKLAPVEAQLLNGIAAEAPELNAWSDATMVRSRLSLYRGRVSAMGMPAPQLGDGLKLKGLGDRFDGTALISGIRHRVSFDGWQTDFQLGMDHELHHEKFQPLAPPAAGLLPGISSLQIGIVAPYEPDDKNEFRVRVQLPALSAKKEHLVLARLLVPDGGKGRGWFFYPEPEDEVLVGFLNGDPRQPIILGALFSSNHTPPADLAKVDEKNAKKGITTKGGHAILFDDTEQTLTIQTADPPKKDDSGGGGEEEAKLNILVFDHKNEKIEIRDKNKNSVTMTKEGGIVVKSEEGPIELHDAKDNIVKMTEEGISVQSTNGAIELKDKDGNTVTLNEDGITLKSDKAFTLDVSGNKLVLDSGGIQLESGGKMAIKASGKVEVEGAAIDLK